MTMKHTQGPWLQADRSVYALTHDGWRKGTETFRNRFYFTIQADNAVPAELRSKFPTMPDFDRDYVDDIIYKAEGC